MAWTHVGRKKEVSDEKNEVSASGWGVVDAILSRLEEVSKVDMGKRRLVH